MSYSGLVSSKYSSGNRIQRGGITKTGNAHLRRVTVEAAWAYHHKPWVGGFLLKRQKDLDQEIKTLPGKRNGVCVRVIRKLAAGGETKPQIVTAIAR
jgi:transposase